MKSLILKKKIYKYRMLLVFTFVFSLVTSYSIERIIKNKEVEFFYISLETNDPLARQMINNIFIYNKIKLEITKKSDPILFKLTNPRGTMDKKLQIAYPDHYSEENIKKIFDTRLIELRENLSKNLTALISLRRQVNPNKDLIQSSLAAINQNKEQIETMKFILNNFKFFKKKELVPKNYFYRLELIFILYFTIILFFIMIKK